MVENAVDSIADSGRTGAVAVHTDRARHALVDLAVAGTAAAAFDGGDEQAARA